MRFGDDAQFLDRSWVEPYTGPRVTCEAHCSERATYTVVLDAEEGRFVSVCEKHLKGYESEVRMSKPSVNGPTVGPTVWESLSLEGWRWFVNVPPFAKQDERGVPSFDEETHLADSRLAEAIGTFGQENVLTGNAWYDGGPFGRPGQIGIYVKEGKT